MGRGRAKAKQTRIARELKYSTPQTDLTALQHELTASTPPSDNDGSAAAEHDRRDDRPGI